MPTNDNTDNVHDNVRDWIVHTEDAEGDSEATVARTTVTSYGLFDRNNPLAEVSVFISQDDGAIVVQIDTNRKHEVPVRVNINDARRPVLDETITP